MSTTSKDRAKLLAALVSIVGLVAAAVYQHTAAMGEIRQLQRDVGRIEIAVDQQGKKLDQVREAVWTLTARDRVARANTNGTP